MPEIIIVDLMHPIPNENQQLQDNYSLFCVEKWQHGVVGNLVVPKPRQSAKNANSTPIELEFLGLGTWNLYFNELHR